MATVTVERFVQSSPSATRPPREPVIGASPAAVPDTAVRRRDWITFEIWVAGFLIMATINLYDLIAGLLR